jgi:hypothetical protein
MIQLDSRSRFTDAPRCTGSRGARSTKYPIIAIGQAYGLDDVSEVAESGDGQRHGVLGVDPVCRVLGDGGEVFAFGEVDVVAVLEGSDQAFWFDVVVAIREVGRADVGIAREAVRLLRRAKVLSI